MCTTPARFCTTSPLTHAPLAPFLPLCSTDRGAQWQHERADGAGSKQQQRAAERVSAAQHVGREQLDVLRHLHQRVQRRRRLPPAALLPLLPQAGTRWPRDRAGLGEERTACSWISLAVCALGCYGASKSSRSKYRFVVCVVQCVDAWLVVNATCPTCRASILSEQEQAALQGGGAHYGTLGGTSVLGRSGGRPASDALV